MGKRMQIHNVNVFLVRCAGDAGWQVRVSGAEELPKDEVLDEVAEAGAEECAGTVCGLWQRQPNVPPPAPLGVCPEIQFQ